MRKFSLSSVARTTCVACAILLVACSPRLDWREVRSPGAPFVILLPAKPASYTRQVNLDGLQVSMTMTAAEVDKVTYAAGTAALPDPAEAPKALAAMKTAMVRNINGTVKQEKVSAAGKVPATIDIEASGADSRLLLARFLAKDNRVYQLVVLGKENTVSREAADTFFNSFKLD